MIKDIFFLFSAFNTISHLHACSRLRFTLGLAVCFKCIEPVSSCELMRLRQCWDPKKVVCTQTTTIIFKLYVVLSSLWYRLVGWILARIQLSLTEVTGFGIDTSGKVSHYDMWNTICHFEQANLGLTHFAADSDEWSTWVGVRTANAVVLWARWRMKLYE